MSLLTKEAIRNTELNITERVDAREFGEGKYVFVRAVTAREKDKYEADRVKISRSKTRPVELDMQDVSAKAAVLGCCDENGSPMFSPEDVEWLSKKPGLAPFLARVKAAFDRVNGFDKDDEEEYLKNSETTATSVSG